MGLYRGYILIMEKKMSLCRGYIGMIGKKRKLLFEV